MPGLQGLGGNWCLGRLGSGLILLYSDSHMGILILILIGNRCGRSSGGKPKRCLGDFVTVAVAFFRVSTVTLQPLHYKTCVVRGGSCVPSPSLSVNAAVITLSASSSLLKFFSGRTSKVPSAYCLDTWVNHKSPQTRRVSNGVSFS